MSIDLIKRLFSPEIFIRGKEYYEKGHVYNIIDMGDKITSKVKSSTKDKIYDVTIEKTLDGIIKSIRCTCPYGSFCKHAAATLIYYIKHGPHKVIEKEIVNPLLEEEEKKDTVREIILKEKSAYSFLYRYFNFLNEENEKKDSINIKERWRIVFVIYKKSFFYEIGKESLKFGLGLIYIKKNGILGRVSDFKMEKLTEPINNEIERKLFNNLILKEDYEDSLSAYFEFLLAYKDQILLYFKRYVYYNRVEFIEIDKLKIEFKLNGIDYKNNQVDFIPIFTIIDKNERSIILKNKEAIDIALDYVIIVDESSKIFYKKAENRYIEFISKILNYNRFYKEDIDFLKDISSNYFKDEIIVEFNKKKIILLNTKPVPILELEFINSEEKTLMSLYFSYKGKEIEYKNDEIKTLIIDNKSNNDEEILLVKRKIELEKKVKKYLDFKFKNVLNDQYWGSNFTFFLEVGVKDFLLQYGMKLMDEGYEIRFKNQKIKLNSGGTFKVKLNITTGIDWFNVSANLVNESGEVKRFKINHDTIRSGIIQTEDGFGIISKEEIENLQKLIKEGLDESGNLKVSKLNFLGVETLYKMVSDKESKEFEDLKSINEIAKKLRNFEKIEKNELPKNFNGKLREYQEAGYNWLHFLHRYNINGCLADDMGLGKTVQTLVFLQSLKEKDELTLSLLIVPVTTVVNWENEIRRFTPDLRIIRHHGNDRIRDKDFFKNFDIIISSYHTIRNDIDFFQDIEFDYLILDESQNIKNNASLLFKTVKSIKSKHRLTLTGTPIENNTFELWAQFNFLNPTLLGSLNDFRYKFANPIEVHKDKEVIERLRKTIYPFILRRKKEEVAKDLPEKEEIILYCEMNKEQKDFYNELRIYYMTHIGEIITKHGIQQSVIQILEALLRLRQACLFPVLVGDKYKDIESTKFETLKDIIDEILQEDHKILLFSQFVQSLKIIEKDIIAKNIKYSYIDGQTKRRDLEIKKFQEEKDVNLFLLSIKAGGVGINLTAADYVILFDPWWNPAVENQAIDRSHRIGQTRKVIVYKLIVKDSIEEKILELQSRKKELVSNLITEDAGFFKSLSKEDIMELFS